MANPIFERGFALLELAFAAAAASLVAVWAASALANRVDDAAAQSTGRWLLGVRQAVDRMLVQDYDILAAGLPDSDAGYADRYAPTLAELKAHGHLPSSFPERPPLGGGAVIRVLRDACPGVQCRVHALVHTLAPVRKPGVGGVDPALIGGVVQAAGGYGGAVYGWDAGRVRGALFDLPNPLPGQAALPEGTVAAYAGLDAAGFERFVRMRDLRDPDLQGNLTVSGDVSAGGYLQVGALAQAGAACESPGQVARDAQGGLLSCRAGQWRGGADGGFGGAYAMNSIYGCKHYTGASTANPRTGDCSCPSGYAAVIVSAGGKWLDTEGWTTGYVCVA